MSGVVLMENIKTIPFKSISKISTELCYQENKSIPDIPIYGVQEAASFCSQEIGNKCVEHVLVLYLSTSYQLIAYSFAAIGTESKCTYSVSEIIRCALLCNATQILLAHNHPSGNLLPSDEDLQATKQLAQAAKLFNIKIIDSIIISPSGESCSMRQHLRTEEAKA